MKKGKELEVIADYAYLGQTQRSWHLWLGNPFCISKQIIPLKKATRNKLVNFAKKCQKQEKKRFAKVFPDIKWDPELLK